MSPAVERLRRTGSSPLKGVSKALFAVLIGGCGQRWMHEPELVRATLPVVELNTFNKSDKVSLTAHSYRVADMG
ncbi:hypothetical protein OHT52_08935 [Streptomyces sp. NBC_00247]|uniref:hypothetical protein n=1 Tax=Streptomyces sp. NBC_00247 TaxID=2975689 RepID=UPI002E2DDAC3|nr:hypothetical protein [Streptomyces sp. NBC_00247]